jgi:hypothetical protein
MTFALGDRVVVSERYRGAGCNHGAIGYFGHVVAVDTTYNDAGEPRETCIRVAFRGHIAGTGANDDYYLAFARDDYGFPCYPFELDHAD